MFVKNRLSKTALCLVGLLVTLALAGCGGGGGRNSGGPIQSAPPPPPPSSTGRFYQVHFVVGFSGRRGLEIVPGNGNNQAVLARGAKDGGPVSGARITYPDNSDQYADASGTFLPSASAYALKNQRLLQTNPNAQPLVIASDPSGKAQPSTARVAAYASAPVAVASVVRSKKSGALGAINNLAGVSLLQATSSIFSSDLLDLDVQGSDVHDNVVDLSTANISYSSSAGGTVVPIAGTTEAYYLPPDVASGSITDAITVTVTVPSTSTQFTATNSVVVVAASGAVNAGGIVQTADGRAMPGAVALFAQLSKYFQPNYWLAATDDTGTYAAQIPGNQIFNLVLGVPATFSPSGSFDYYVASSDAAGTATSFTSGITANSTLNLFLPPAAPFFTNEPSSSLPSYVGFVRDAWYNTVDASSLRIFEAGSGIQPLLATVPVTFPSPASPAPIGAGQLANWCYQWQQLGGAPTLVVVEASGGCTQPGNEAFTIVPAAANTFDYVKYVSNTAFSLASPLDVTTNTQLAESGSWQQQLTGMPVSSDIASVSAQLYDTANQTLGSPVYNEALQYSYTVDAGGRSTEQFTNDTRTSAGDGTLVAIYNATKTQTDDLANCRNTAAPCFALSGTVAESFDPSSGTFSQNYTLNSVINGDGSATLAYQSTADASKVIIPLAPAAQANSAPYDIVNSATPGRVYDTDGTSQIGSFTVNNARLVKFLELDPANGGGVVNRLGFIL